MAGWENHGQRLLAHVLGSYDASLTRIAFICQRFHGDGQELRFPSDACWGSFTEKLSFRLVTHTLESQFLSNYVVCLPCLRAAVVLWRALLRVPWSERAAMRRCAACGSLCLVCAQSVGRIVSRPLDNTLVATPCVGSPYLFTLFQPASLGRPRR